MRLYIVLRHFYVYIQVRATTMDRPYGQIKIHICIPHQLRIMNYELFSFPPENLVILMDYLICARNFQLES